MGFAFSFGAGVLRRGAETGAHRDANRQRQPHLPAEHVRHLCRLVVDLVEREPREIGPHHVDHRPQPCRGGTDPRSYEAGLRDRRVADAFGPEQGEEALRGAERATHRVLLGAASPRAADDVLADHDHGRVGLHGLAHRLADGVDHRQRALRRSHHQATPTRVICSG